MHRMLQPWEDDTTLIAYLRELERQVEVMESLMTEEQMSCMKVIMQDLREDSLMLDPDVWSGLPEN